MLPTFVSGAERYLVSLMALCRSLQLCIFIVSSVVRLPRFRRCSSVRHEFPVVTFHFDSKPSLSAFANIDQPKFGLIEQHNRNRQSGRHGAQSLFGYYVEAIPSSYEHSRFLVHGHRPQQ